MSRASEVLAMFNEFEEKGLKKLLKSRGWKYTGKVHGGGATWRKNDIICSINPREKRASFYGVASQFGNPDFEKERVGFDDEKKLLKMLDDVDELTNKK